MGCIESSEIEVTTNRIANVRNLAIERARHMRRKKNQEPYKTRLASIYTSEDIKCISDEERKAGYHPNYTCPICCQYYDKILACTQCQNFICHYCFHTYEKKWKYLMKCSFCSSKKSLFTDYEREARSYFDTSKKFSMNKQGDSAKHDQTQEQSGRLDLVSEFQEIQGH